jgi:hypothetical protein
MNSTGIKSVRYRTSSWAILGSVLLIGVAYYFFTFSVWNIADIISVYFLHSNPNRTRGNAWAMIWMTPLFAGTETIFIASLPVLIVAPGAAL